MSSQTPCFRAAAWTCPAVDGLVKEGGESAGDVGDQQVLDAAIIAASQAVEHYEITRYGTMIAWRQTLGLPQVAKLLQKNLSQEYAADKKLSQLAESSLNRQAAA